MTSYKNVKKFKYERNSSDVVSLREYIIFDDAASGNKYALLNFYNNLNQQLYGLKFEILQHDRDGKVICKSLLLHDKFTAPCNDSFVPQAKVKLSSNCESISYRLVAARFDRVKWEKGEFTDNEYAFDRYVADSGSAVPTVAAPAAEEKPKKQKKIKNKFEIKRITRQTRAKFPVVFAVLAVIVFIGGVVASSLFVRFNSANRSVYGDFLIRTDGSAVTILGYEGKSADVTIPKTIDDRAVTRIDAEAFKYSRVKNLVIEADRLTVGENAFYGSKLQTVKGSGSVRLLSGAFAKCADLKSVNLPDADITSYVFNSCCSDSKKLEIITNNLLPRNAFRDCPKIAELSVKASSVTSQSLRGLDGLTSLSLDADLQCDSFVLLFYGSLSECKKRTFKVVKLRNGADYQAFFADCESCGVTVKQLSWI